MLRINLLPREVLDRHRYEGWYRYVFIVTIGVVLMVLLGAAGFFVAIQQKNDELQTKREQAKQYDEQGHAFDIFEKKEKELNDRQAIAQSALADRINLGKVAEEVSLVLPDEVWLDSLTIDQVAGLSFNANTPRSGSEGMNVAYKSVAKTLVRLNELPDVTDVWLSSASNLTWNHYDTATVITTPTPVVQFTTLAKVTRTVVPSTTVGE